MNYPPNSQKKLGDKLTSQPTDSNVDYDIDYGLKSAPGSSTYVDAFQFKIKNGSKVQDALKSDKLNLQLKNAPSENKILQVAIREGSGTLDDAVDASQFASRLNSAKQSIPGFRLVITDHLGNPIPGGTF